MTVAFKPRYPKSREAYDRDAQRQRLDARAKILRAPMPRTCVIVGGAGASRRLADILAPLIGDVVVAAEHPDDTLDRVMALTLGGPAPRIIIIGPARVAGPLLANLARRRAARSWPGPVDLLHGLRSRDREAFLRLAIRAARARAP